VLQTPLFTFLSHGDKESVWNVDGELLLARQLQDKYFVGLLLYLQGDQKLEHAEELSYLFNSGFEEDKCAYILHFKDEIESRSFPHVVDCSDYHFLVETYINETPEFIIFLSWSRRIQPYS
jgi:hypothetical protein